MSSAAIRLSELLSAFEFASAGGGVEAEAYLCLDSGKIYYRSDYVDEAEDLPDDLETSDRYLAVPTQRELRLGRELALSFVAEGAPGDYDRVAGFFQRSGAYARFKDLLEMRGLLQRWYDFETNATEQALRAWCQENDVQLIEDE